MTTDGTLSTLWISCPANRGSEIQDGPIELPDSSSRQDFPAVGLEDRIVTQVRQLPALEIPLYKPGHVHVQERFSLAVNLAQDCIRDVLPNARKSFDRFAGPWQSVPPLRHCLGQFEQCVGASLPKSKRFQVGLQLMGPRLSEALPRWEPLQKARVPRGNRFRLGSLEEDFRYRQFVVPEPVGSPGKRPSMVKEPVLKNSPQVSGPKAS